MATIVFTGRVGSDGELREMQDGTAVLGFSVADDVGYGDKKTTQWLKCAMFGKRAASVAPYVLKGAIVEVVGTPTVEAWAKKGDGTPQAAIKVRVSELKLHGGKRDDAPVADKGRSTRGHDDMDSEIPF